MSAVLQQNPPHFHFQSLAPQFESLQIRFHWRNRSSSCHKVCPKEGGACRSRSTLEAGWVSSPRAAGASCLLCLTVRTVAASLTKTTQVQGVLGTLVPMFPHTVVDCLIALSDLRARWETIASLALGGRRHGAVDDSTWAQRPERCFQTLFMFVRAPLKMLYRGVWGGMVPDSLRALLN